MQDWRESLSPQLCEPYRSAIISLDPDTASQVRELRIRAGRPMTALAKKELFLGERGVCGESDAIISQSTDVARLLKTLCGYSLYAHEEDMRRGFLALKGGFRVGIVGHAVVDSGEIARLHRVGGFNIRIAREVPGAAARLLPHILSAGIVRSTLILSAPGLGKTTMLRDAIRSISNTGFSVALADERGEVAALCDGVPQLDVGLRTDVLDGCPKEIALSMLLRTMSPQVLATDELGSPGEATAIRSAVAAGAAVLATAHAPGYKEAGQHPFLAEILPLFPRVAVLERSIGNIGSIYADGKRVGG